MSTCTFVTTSGAHCVEGDSASANVCSILASSFQNGNLQFDKAPCAFFVDQDSIVRSIDDLKSAFPDSALHAFAVKALPLRGCLRKMLSMGLGVEVASFCELQLALQEGFDPNQIVFDSPCKTESELAASLKQGVRLNIDNFQELELVNNLIKTDLPKQSRYIGLRITPGISLTGLATREGTGCAMSWTAGTRSKFGINLSEYKAEIMAAFQKHGWLNSLHVHVGSQFSTIPAMVAAVKALVELALEINIFLNEVRIQWLDIGGGLPVNYESDVEQPKFKDYATALYAEIPGLRKFNVLTEMGRSLIQKAGFYTSVVQYVKSNGGRNIATIMAGADLFPRSAYCPEVWQHRVTAHSGIDGIRRIKAESLSNPPTKLWDIAGPLCFSGDVIARDVCLPSDLTRLRDWLVIHDVGGYTLSMFSHYNSRPSPKVLAFSCQQGQIKFELWKKEDSIEQVLSLWS